MHSWQLQQAKAHLSDLVRQAAAGQPQEITVRGEPTVVILSIVQYEQLTHPKPSLVTFLRQSPLFGNEFEIIRDKSPDRDIDL
jgi:prevent-host-death family protein